MKWFIIEKIKQEKIIILWFNKEMSFIYLYMYIVDIQ